jgi:hypothetical protein
LRRPRPARDHRWEFDGSYLTRIEEPTDGWPRTRVRRRTDGIPWSDPTLRRGIQYACSVVAMLVVESAAAASPAGSSVTVPTENVLTVPKEAAVMTQPNDDLDDLRARVAAMQATNDLGVTRLAQRGVGVNVPGVRLDELVEHLLGDMDDPRRLAYEERVQRRFTEIITEAEGQIARSVLLQGVNGHQLPGQR